MDVNTPASVDRFQDIVDNGDLNAVNSRHDPVTGLSHVRRIEFNNGDELRFTENVVVVDLTDSTAYDDDDDDDDNPRIFECRRAGPPPNVVAPTVGARLYVGAYNDDNDAEQRVGLFLTAEAAVAAAKLVAVANGRQEYNAIDPPEVIQYHLSFDVFAADHEEAVRRATLAKVRRLNLSAKELAAIGLTPENLVLSAGD